MPAPISAGEVRVLRCLPEAALARLLGAGREVAVRRGAVVYRRDGAPALYALLRGRVAVAAESVAAGSTAGLTLAILRAGDLFGEASLFAGRHLDEARALEAAVVRRIEARAARDALEAHPRAALALAALIAERRAAAEVRLCELASEPVRGRVLHQLRRLAAEASVADSRGRILADRLTHEELARLVGASRVAVSRALAALRRGGEIAMSGGRIVVAPGGGAEPGATDSLVA